ncbi:MAG: hypothetical protein ACPGC9_01710 [Cytophagales bacterium]
MEKQTQELDQNPHHNQSSLKSIPHLLTWFSLLAFAIQPAKASQHSPWISGVCTHYFQEETSYFWNASKIEKLTYVLSILMPLWIGIEEIKHMIGHCRKDAQGIWQSCGQNNRGHLIMKLGWLGIVMLFGVIWLSFTKRDKTSLKYEIKEASPRNKGVVVNKLLYLMDGE